MTVVMVERAMLGRTPALLEAALVGLPDDLLSFTDGPNGFTPWDVAAHMLDADVVNWMPRVRRFLDDERDTPLPSYDRFAFRDTYGGWSIERVVAAFSEERGRGLEALAGLSIDAKALGRTRRHPQLDLVTLGNLVSTWVVHDLTHLNQINRILALAWREAVGPFRPLLRVLR